MLLRQPDGIAKLMMASNAGISVTINEMRQLPAMRAEQAAEIPGTQTLGPPFSHPRLGVHDSRRRRSARLRLSGDCSELHNVVEQPN
jgi:hypothetical protein